MALGQKQALKNLIAAAKALNNKFDVKDEFLPLVAEFNNAAKEAEAVLEAAEGRKAKKNGQVPGNGGCETERGDN